ncbi:hypothetical protein SK128_012797 [Halocaridina rubra]|uniref:Lipase n=1 Tax=Halocaridina rubra TaxID=373956 RepID=A0AAN9AH38_HALRR
MLRILAKLLTLAAVLATQQEPPTLNMDSEKPHSRHVRQNLHPHTHLPTPGLIQARGYPAEVHHVITDDGYILEMHRIPYSPRRPRPHVNPIQQNIHTKNNVIRSLLLQQRARNTSIEVLRKSVENLSRKMSIDASKKVVFIQHCVMCSSADFVMNEPDQALAFMLSDAGYDVWLGNARGNFYSRRHVILSPSQTKFWDFSWDKMGRYDMPAMLRYVKKATGVEQLNYIGHSMGTSIFFAMMNYHPHINSWIRVMTALAPVAYMHNKHAPFRFFTPFAEGIDRAFTRRGLPELGRATAESSSFASAFCSPLSIFQPLCKLFFAFVGGPNNSKYVDKEYLPVIAAHTPAGSSIHVLTHFLQLVRDRQFQAYDYGVTRNLREYGSPRPNAFKLSAITCPVGAFFADNDWVADFADVRQTLSELPKVVYMHRVQVKDFNHLDFLWGENAGHLVYRYVVDFLNLYN